MESEPEIQSIKRRIERLEKVVRQMIEEYPTGEEIEEYINASLDFERGDVVSLDEVERKRNEKNLSD